LQRLKSSQSLRFNASQNPSNQASRLALSLPTKTLSNHPQGLRSLSEDLHWLYSTPSAVENADGGLMKTAQIILWVNLNALRTLRATKRRVGKPDAAEKKIHANPICVKTPTSRKNKQPPLWEMAVCNVW